MTFKHKQLLEPIPLQTFFKHDTTEPVLKDDTPALIGPKLLCYISRLPKDIGL